MNERDSEAAAALLVSLGHEPAEESAADVVIVNTCSVRGKAEEKAVGKLQLLIAGRKTGKLPLVGAMGCMVARMGVDLFRKVKGLDFAVGPGRLAALPATIAAAAAGKPPDMDNLTFGIADEGAMRHHVGGAQCAFITISQGCNRGCSYCIVPAVRGPERSRPAADILNEVKTLVEQGARDITLLGQSVTNYGWFNETWNPAYKSPMGLREALPRLLEAAGAVAGPARLRFTSGHPSGCTAELARAMKEIPAVCNHLHLPLQSGSDRILRLMGRGYTAAEYLEAVARVRGAAPEMSVTTDIIVGFPTESEEDFEQTRRIMEKAEFDNAFIFKYSPRPGTAAEKMADDIPPEVKLERNHTLLRDQDERSLRINNTYVGRELEVLLEGPSLRDKTRPAGRSRNNKIVIVTSGQGDKQHGFARVIIESARSQTLYGRLQA